MTGHLFILIIMIWINICSTQIKLFPTVYSLFFSWIGKVSSWWKPPVIWNCQTQGRHDERWFCFWLLFVLIVLFSIYRLTGDEAGTPYDKESMAIIHLNNTTVMYLKEVTKFLALVCFLREESFERKGELSWQQGNMFGVILLSFFHLAGCHME